MVTQKANEILRSLEKKNILTGKKQDKKLWKIFWSTFYLSAFTFGGGYVIVSLMKKKFVDEYHWIEEEEMLDLVAIAQSAPDINWLELRGF